VRKHFLATDCFVLVQTLKSKFEVLERKGGGWRNIRKEKRRKDDEMEGRRLISDHLR
jgi:hypothetical protein